MNQCEGGGDAVDRETEDDKGAGSAEDDKSDKIESGMMAKVDNEDPSNEIPRAEVTAVEEQVPVAEVPKAEDGPADKESKKVEDTGPHEISVGGHGDGSEAGRREEANTEPQEVEVAEVGCEDRSETGTKEATGVEMQEVPKVTNTETSGGVQQIEPEAEPQEAIEEVTKKNLEPGPGDNNGEQVLHTAEEDPLQDKDMEAASDEGGISVDDTKIQTAIVTEETKVVDPVTNTKPAENDQEPPARQSVEDLEPERKPEDEPKTDDEKANGNVTEVVSSSLFPNFSPESLTTEEQVPVPQVEVPREIQETAAEEKKEELWLKQNFVEGTDLKIEASEEEDEDIRVQEELASSSPEKLLEATLAKKKRKLKTLKEPLLKALLKRSVQQIYEPEQDLKMESEEEELQASQERVVLSPQKKVKTDVERQTAREVEEAPGHPESVVPAAGSGRVDEEISETGTVTKTNVTEEEAPCSSIVEAKEAKTVSGRLAADFSVGAAATEDTAKNTDAVIDKNELSLCSGSLGSQPIVIDDSSDTISQDSKEFSSESELETRSSPVVQTGNVVTDLAEEADDKKIVVGGESQDEISTDNITNISDCPSSGEAASDEWETLPEEPSPSPTCESESPRNFAEKFAGHSNVKFSSYSYKAPVANNQQAATEAQIDNWDDSSASGSIDESTPSQAAIKTEEKETKVSLESDGFKEWKEDCQKEKLEAPEILWGLTASSMETLKPDEPWAPIQTLKWMQEELKAKITYRITLVDNRDNGPAVRVLKMKKEDLRPARYLVEVIVKFQLEKSHTFTGKCLSDCKILAFNGAIQYIVLRMGNVRRETRGSPLPYVPFTEVPLVLRSKLQSFEVLKKNQHQHKEFKVLDEVEEMNGLTWYGCTISFVNNEGKISHCKRCGLTKDLARISAANAVWLKLGWHRKDLWYKSTKERFCHFAPIQEGLPFFPLNLDGVRVPVVTDPSVRKDTKQSNHDKGTEEFRSIRTMTFAPQQPYGSDDGTSLWSRGTATTVDDWDIPEPKSASVSKHENEESLEELQVQPRSESIPNSNSFDLQSRSTDSRNSSSTMARDIKSPQFDDWNGPSHPVHFDEPRHYEIVPAQQHFTQDSSLQPSDRQSASGETHAAEKNPSWQSERDSGTEETAGHNNKLEEDVFCKAPVDFSVKSAQVPILDHGKEWEAAKIPAEASRILDEAESVLVVAAKVNTPSKAHHVSVTIELEEEEEHQMTAATEVPESNVADIAGSGANGATKVGNPAQTATSATMMQVAAKVTLHVRNHDESASTVNSADTNASEDYESKTPNSLFVNADSDDIARLSDCATLLEDEVDAARSLQSDFLDLDDSLERSKERAEAHNVGLSFEENTENATFFTSSTSDKDEDQSMMLNVGFLEKTGDVTDAKGDISSELESTRTEYSFGTPKAESSGLDLIPAATSTSVVPDSQDFSCQCNLEQSLAPPSAGSSQQVVDLASTNMAAAFCNFFMAYVALADAKDRLDEARRLNQEQ